MPPRPSATSRSFLSDIAHGGITEQAAKQYVEPAIANNPIVFPPAADVAKLAVPEALPQDALRVQTRTFQSFKAGR